MIFGNYDHDHDEGITLGFIPSMQHTFVYVVVVVVERTVLECSSDPIQSRQYSRVGTAPLISYRELGEIMNSLSPSRFWPFSQSHV